MQAEFSYKRRDLFQPEHFAHLFLSHSCTPSSLTTTFSSVPFYLKNKKKRSESGRKSALIYLMAMVVRKRCQSLMAAVETPPTALLLFFFMTVRHLPFYHRIPLLHARSRSDESCLSVALVQCVTCTKRCQRRTRKESLTSEKERAIETLGPMNVDFDNDLRILFLRKSACSRAGWLYTHRQIGAAMGWLLRPLYLCPGCGCCRNATCCERPFPLPVYAAHQEAMDFHLYSKRNK